MIRYDTQGDFEADEAWSVFNFGDVNGEAFRFAGAVFDGRYVYYAPNSGEFAGCATIGTRCPIVMTRRCM